MTSAVALAIKIGLDPTLFEVAGVEVTWHGLFTAVGVVVGVTLAAVLARRAGFQEEAIYNFALALVVGGIIGARSLYVIENWSDFKDDLGEIFAINTGGISIYGALIGGAIGAWLYARFTKLQDIPRAADIAAIGGILGMAVGRIGDVINGEHFSKTSDLPWAVRYTHVDSPSYLYFGGPNVTQHPAVAYEMLGDLVILALILLIYLRVARHGIAFFAWMFLYGALRVGVSFLRLDDLVWLGLRTAQLIGIVSMAVALPAIIYMLRTPPEEERMSRADRRRLMREEGAEGEPSPGS